MAIVRPMWLTGGMSGRADKTSNTYTKQTSITGKTVAVTLRNPVGYDKQGAKVIAAQNEFHAKSKGVTIFYNRISAIGASAEDQALYKSIVSFVRGQHRYGTVRGYLMSKCATVNEDLTQVKIVYRDHEETINVSFQARGVVRNPEDEGFSGDGSGSTDSGNGGSTENPSAGGSFTIAAGVGSDGGGSVTIKKNGQLISGNTVMASANDTVVLQGVPESDNWQFMSWSDGNSQNPRTIQPSADMNVTA
ncbi:MAG: hypothetical protein IKM71_08175, partial [Bacteroidaceae bacterium]|nr:hypothetical protein [Bacteroidaceae bacterium]